jgi:hypothetical protein
MLKKVQKFNRLLRSGVGPKQAKGMLLAVRLSHSAKFFYELDQYELNLYCMKNLERVKNVKADVMEDGLLRDHVAISNDDKFIIISTENLWIHVYNIDYNEGLHQKRKQDKHDIETALSKKRQNILYKRSNCKSDQVENYFKGGSSTRTQKKRQTFMHNHLNQAAVDALQRSKSNTSVRRDSTGEATKNSRGRSSTVLILPVDADADGDGELDHPERRHMLAKRLKSFKIADKIKILKAGCSGNIIFAVLRNNTIKAYDLDLLVEIKNFSQLLPRFINMKMTGPDKESYAINNVSLADDNSIILVTGKKSWFSIIDFDSKKDIYCMKLRKNLKTGFILMRQKIIVLIYENYLLEIMN